MAFSIESITGLFKRNKKARDPFGIDDDEDFGDEDFGSDDFDEESEGRSLAHKIAIGVSVAMSVLLVAFIGAILMTADDTPGPVAGVMPTEITQVVDEEGRVVQDLAAERAAQQAAEEAAAAQSDADEVTSLPPMGDVSGTIVDDQMAQTDRSAQRRPWLNDGSTDSGNDQQPSDESANSGGRAGSMDDLLRQTQQGRPEPAPRQNEPTDPMSEPETDMAAEVPADMPTEMATAMPGDADRTATEMPGAAMPIEGEEVNDAAPAGPTELVPGAAGRFASTEALQPTSNQPGAGPRLSEPETPPTDSRAISAAPPRFATLPKADALPQLAEARARVAIIIEGLGLNRVATEAAIDSLPPSVTLAFSPYTRDLPDWLERARTAGHEVLIEVPMESKSFPADDPGPFGLLTSLDQLQNVERLTAILSSAEGTPGILDVSGSRFRESTEHINIVMNNLDARGMFYVQGRPGLRLGNDKVPSATADIVIDERNFRASIDARLDYIEELARYQGSSVAVASARPATFERITLWLDDVNRRGIAVAPVSQVLIQ